MGKKSRKKQQNKKAAPSTTAPRQVAAVTPASLGGSATRTAQVAKGRSSNILEIPSQYVRQDIVRLLLLIVITLLLLTVAYISKIKTPYIDRAGEEVARFIDLG